MLSKDFLKNHQTKLEDNGRRRRFNIFTCWYHSNSARLSPSPDVTLESSAKQKSAIYRPSFPRQQRLELSAKQS